VEAYFTGNAALYSPRDGMVAHNSRVHILENVVVGADGSGIFLEGMICSYLINTIDTYCMLLFLTFETIIIHTLFFRLNRNRSSDE
jgi:hypothetical protein